MRRKKVLLASKVAPNKVTLRGPALNVHMLQLKKAEKEDKAK